MTQFTYTFTEAEQHAPVGSKVTYNVTPEVLPKGATSFTVNAKVVSSVTSEGENLRYYYPLYFTIENNKGEKISDASPWAVFDWSTGKDTYSVTIPKIKQPIIGNQGESSVPLFLVAHMNFMYTDGAFAQKTIANLPITTPNVDDQLKPTFSIPTNIDPSDYMERGSGVPDGWPIYCGISVGTNTYPNMHVWFDGQWVNTYAGSTLAAITCELRYLDAAGNWVANSDYPMTFDGGIHWHCWMLPVPDPPTSDTRMRLVITAYDSANRSSSTIFTTLEPPKYIPPKLVSYRADRCDESGNIDDEGAYVSAKVKYQLWTPPNVEEQYANTASGSVLIVKGIDTSDGTTIDQVSNVESDTVYVFGDGSLLPDKEYDVLYKISDQTPYPTASYTIDHIDQTYNTIDFLSGGKGITFGGFATKEGFVNYMPSYFENMVEFENTATAKIHSSIYATKSDGSQWAWMWDRASGNLHTMSNMYFKNPDMTKNGFIWDAVNYKAYLQTVMSVSNAGKIDGPANRSSWFDGRDKAWLRQKSTPTNGYCPMMSIKTPAGSWEIGQYGYSNSAENLYFTYVKDTDYNAKTNNALRFMFDPRASKLQKLILGDETLLNLVYPVGAVYLSFSSTSPASLFGGTWTQINGYFLRAANDTGTGGSNNHKHGAWTSAQTDGYMGRFAIATDNYIYYQYVSSSSYATNYWGGVNSHGTSGSKNQGSGMAIHGYSANASTMPLYQDVYAWRRTA